MLKKEEKKALINFKNDIRRFLNEWSEEGLLNLEEQKQNVKIISVVQLCGKISAATVSAVGSSLTLTGYPKVGGIITATGVLFPLVEYYASRRKEKISAKNYDIKKFHEDARKLWDSYRNHKEEINKFFYIDALEVKDIEDELKPKKEEEPSASVMHSLGMHSLGTIRVAFSNRVLVNNRGLFRTELKRIESGIEAILKGDNIDSEVDFNALDAENLNME